jgi:Arc/MetJ-type ribon-helix-helix transcriptional regulator
MDRITITLPEEVVEQIDRLDRNRSRFVLGAVRQELERRRREELLRSLETAHDQTEELAEAGFDDWAARLPDEDADGLVDAAVGRAIRWSRDEGWTETDQ